MNLNTGLLLIHANDAFNKRLFDKYLSNLKVPSRRNPRIYVQPLMKSEQNKIIIGFQDAAYNVFGELIDEQLQEAKNNEY